jgi:hypothetical protein
VEDLSICRAAVREATENNLEKIKKSYTAAQKEVK